MPPEKHALLSASSAARWMICTAAPRYEATFPESTSAYAEEGRLAHALCEAKVRKWNGEITQRKYRETLKHLQADPLYDPEMEETSAGYLAHLMDRAALFSRPPAIACEAQVPLTAYVPEGFGTCDCVMVGGDLLAITDYKHGKGVPVSAIGNPQLRLYALGALDLYAPVYGDAIRRVCVTIDQPRLDSLSSEMMSVEDLRAWGETVKPLARRAYDGQGEFVPGDHCRFCRGRAVCRARADANTALEDFKDVALPDAAASPRLTDAEIGGLLTRGAQLVDWYKDIEAYAQRALLEGKAIDGWKLVAGRSVRTFTDQDKALDACVAAGYDEALLYDRKPKTLSELEKLLGKSRFADVCGGYLIKPPGKPTLVPASDKREPYQPAAADFAGCTESQNH